MKMPVVQKPLSRRSASQPGSAIQALSSRAEMVPSAAKVAKARMWPTRRMAWPDSRQPSSIPAA